MPSQASQPGHGPRPLAIVPAAGSSTRMGRPKLLLPWGLETVIGATLRALLAGGVEEAVVVVAAAGPLAGWQPPAGVRRVVNADPARGMLSSVLAGLAALAPTTPDPLVVCPADLPALRAETVVALLTVYRREGGVVVPRCGDGRGSKRGHPLLLAPAWQQRIPELAIHEGGLRRILELAAGAVHEVAVDDPGTLHDVDTPEDYERLRPR
ncbi:MAG TPA: nucleotidyltransferase family protein [Thermoanaerobaculia bacterium]|jgi:molybdenum cofactor cytidylyltransferase|nr:nucleotidyltransferase family protein [Thermoanaerobaculia bacterium]